MIIETISSGNLGAPFGAPLLGCMGGRKPNIVWASYAEEVRIPKLLNEGYVGIEISKISKGEGAKRMKEESRLKATLLDA